MKCTNISRFIRVNLLKMKDKKILEGSKRKRNIKNRGTKIN